MRPALSYALVSVLLLVYIVFVGHRGVLLISWGTWVTVPFGIAVLVLPLLGCWFLWHSTRFVRQANRLARELAAEDGLPVDDLPRTPSGRIDRDGADAVFARRQAETEADPGDWRRWFRLAVAYHDARDTPRARRAMNHAIALHAGAAAEPPPATPAAAPAEAAEPR